ncbi:MAG: hypothetical protein ACJAVI_003744 [Candidatus Azotimanducaceae bacterium]|jgi:hypothetical protein
MSLVMGRWARRFKLFSPARDRQRGSPRHCIMASLMNAKRASDQPIYVTTGPTLGESHRRAGM